MNQSESSNKSVKKNTVILTTPCLFYSARESADELVKVDTSGKYVMPAVVQALKARVDCYTPCLKSEICSILDSRLNKLKLIGKPKVLVFDIDDTLVASKVPCMLKYYDHISTIRDVRQDWLTELGEFMVQKACFLKEKCIILAHTSRMLDSKLSTDIDQLEAMGIGFFDYCMYRPDGERFLEASLLKLLQLRELVNALGDEVILYAFFDDLQECRDQYTSYFKHVPNIDGKTKFSDIQYIFDELI